MSELQEAQQAQEILARLIEGRAETRRTYHDPKSGTEFLIEIPSNLSELIKAMNVPDSVHQRYGILIVEGQRYEIDRDALGMCYRCSLFVRSPQLTLDQWVFLSTQRADLLIALNAELSDLLLQAVNASASHPLAWSNLGKP